MHSILPDTTPELSLVRQLKSVYAQPCPVYPTSSLSPCMIRGWHRTLQCIDSGGDETRGFCRPTLFPPRSNKIPLLPLQEFKNTRTARETRKSLPALFGFSSLLGEHDTRFVPPIVALRYIKSALIIVKRPRRFSSAPRITSVVARGQLFEQVVPHHACHAISLAGVHNERGFQRLCEVRCIMSSRIGASPITIE